MAHQVASSIEIPATISPANADAFRMQVLELLKSGKETASNVSLDLEGQSLTPVAVQLLTATMRSADRLGVSLDVSEKCHSVLTDLQLT